MLTPASDAVDEHIYLNIGASLGNGSGTSRLNATGITNIGAWLNSNRSYSLVTNKKHRILHIVGGGANIDNRVGDGSAPWTNTDKDYFYSIYYESDQRHTALGLAVKHARVYNLKTAQIAVGSTAPDSQHDYINPDLLFDNATTGTMFTVMVGGGAGIIAGQLNLYNPTMIFSGVGGRLFNGTNINHLDFNVFGGCLYAAAYTNTQYFQILNSGCGLVAKFYNTSIYKTGFVNRFLAYQAGYVEGSKIPGIDFVSVASNALSFDPVDNFTLTSIFYAQAVDDLFANPADNNYLTPSLSPLIGVGTDLTTIPSYGYIDYDSWDIGLRVAEPMPGALQVSALVSDSGNKLFKPGDGITLTVVGDIGSTAGSIVIKNYAATWETDVPVTSWDNATKTITASFPVDADFRYGDDDNIIYVTRADSEPFNPFTQVTVLPPLGMEIINGNSPSTSEYSIFKDALSVPAGVYQIRWRDPDATGAVINAYGEIVSSTGFGDIYVSVWDAADNTTSDEYLFSVNDGGSTGTIPVMPDDRAVTVYAGALTLGTFPAVSGTTPISYSLGGDDAELFTINSTTAKVDPIDTLVAGQEGNISVVPSNSAGTGIAQVITWSVIARPEPPGDKGIGLTMAPLIVKPLSMTSMNMTPL